MYTCICITRITRIARIARIVRTTRIARSSNEDCNNSWRRHARTHARAQREKLRLVDSTFES